jgi:hypothetical protein
MTVEYDRDKSLAVMRGKLQNVSVIYAEANEVGLHLPVACALMQKESGGANIYGNDEGGMLQGFPDLVNKDNWEAFWWMVSHKGHQSNGVGPSQITSRGLLQSMLDKGLKPWSIGDNMKFGFTRLLDYHDSAPEGERPWVYAGTLYNGSLTYGLDLAERIQDWREALRGAKL